MLHQGCFHRLANVKKKLFVCLNDCIKVRKWTGRNRTNQWTSTKKQVVKPLPSWMKDVFPIENGQFSKVMLVFWGFSTPEKNERHFEPQTFWRFWLVQGWFFPLGVHLFWGWTPRREIWSTGDEWREVWDYDDRYKKAMELPPARRADENGEWLNTWPFKWWNSWLPKKGDF